MPQPTRPQLALYAAFAIAVLLIGGRFLRSGESASAGGSGLDGGALGASAPDGAGASPGAGAAGDPGGAAGDDAAAALGGAGGESGGAAGDDAGGAAGDAGADAALGDAAAGGAVVDVKGAVRHPGVYRVADGARVLDAVERAGGLARRADRRGVNLAARVVDGGEVVVPRKGERVSAASAPAGAGGTSAAADDGAAAADVPLALDINTASATELEQLDGVGPATAAKIVAYRDQHGPFGSIEELDAVSGIGEAKLAAIRAQLGR